ncbi:hypothetical protein BTE77_35520 [Ensifer adhaerens]|nr:hypothetical protein BTE77_35520 [Ensifer adhaerens]
MLMFSSNEAARHAGVSRSTILRAINAAELSALRDGHGHWRIDADNLDRWLDQRHGIQIRQPREPVSCDAHFYFYGRDITDLLSIIDIDRRSARTERDQVIAALASFDEPTWSRSAFIPPTTLEIEWWPLALSL